MLNLEKLRHRIGFTQREAAEYLEVPIKTLQKWEQGDRTPPLWAQKMVVEKLNSIRGADEATKKLKLIIEANPYMKNMDHHQVRKELHILYKKHSQAAYEAQIEDKQYEDWEIPYIIEDIWIGEYAALNAQIEDLASIMGSTVYDDIIGPFTNKNPYLYGNTAYFDSLMTDALSGLLKPYFEKHKKELAALKLPPQEPVPPPTREIYIDSDKQKYPSEDFGEFRFIIYRNEYGPDYEGTRRFYWDYEIYCVGELVFSEKRPSVNGRRIWDSKSIRYHVKNKTLALKDK